MEQQFSYFWKLQVLARRKTSNRRQGQKHNQEGYASYPPRSAQDTQSIPGQQRCGHTCDIMDTSQPA